MIYICSIRLPGKRRLTHRDSHGVGGGRHQRLPHRLRLRSQLSGTKGRRRRRLGRPLRRRSDDRLPPGVAVVLAGRLDDGGADVRVGDEVQSLLLRHLRHPLEFGDLQVFIHYHCDFVNLKQISPSFEPSDLFVRSDVRLRI